MNDMNINELQEYIKDKLHMKGHKCEELLSFDMKNLGRLVRLYGLLMNKCNERVFLRGQYKHHNYQMYPSICHGYGKDDRLFLGKLMKNLTYIQESFHEVLPDNTRFANSNIIPIFQHYGIYTPWLDAVDNLFVALWFANNKFIKDSNEEEDDDYRYLFFLVVEQGKPEDYKQVGTNTQWIDIRRSHTSLSLRPHTQHGILISRKHDLDNFYGNSSDLDLKDNVVCVVRFHKDSEIGRFMINPAGKDANMLRNFFYPPEDIDDTLNRIVRPVVKKKIIKKIIQNGFTKTELSQVGSYFSE